MSLLVMHDRKHHFNYIHKALFRQAFIDIFPLIFARKTLYTGYPPPIHTKLWITAVKPVYPLSCTQIYSHFLVDVILSTKCG